MPSAPVAASAAPTSPTSSVSFPELLHLAQTARDTRDYALNLGIDESALVRYADGAVCDEEHRIITGVLAKNRWSLDFLKSYLDQKRRRGQHKRRVA